MERINGELTIRLMGIFMRYPCLCSDEVKELEFRTQDGNRTVIVHRPVNSLRAWKVFMFCLWKAKEYKPVGENMFLVRVLKKDLRAFLRKDELTSRGLWEVLSPLADVSYVVVERKQDGKKKEFVSYSFRLLYKIVKHTGEEDNVESGLLELLIDETFYNFCLKSNVFLYMPFLVRLHSVFAINLFVYLTVNWDTSSFSEAILFERLGFVSQPDKEKRRILKGAFLSLKELGFIKDFSYDVQERRWNVERYDGNSFRIRAIELLNQFKEREQEIRRRETENKRRWRQKKRLIDGS